MSTFWVVVVLFPVAWLLDALVEIMGGVLGYDKAMPRFLILFVLLACYIGTWVGLRN